MWHYGTGRGSSVGKLVLPHLQFSSHLTFKLRINAQLKKNKVRNVWSRRPLLAVPVTWLYNWLWVRLLYQPLRGASSARNSGIFWLAAIALVGTESYFLFHHVRRNAFSKQILLNHGHALVQEVSQTKVKFPSLRALKCLSELLHKDSLDVEPVALNLLADQPDEGP